MSAIQMRVDCILTLLHAERPKLYGVLAVLSAIGLKSQITRITTYLNAQILDYFGKSFCSWKLWDRIYDKKPQCCANKHMWGR